MTFRKTGAAMAAVWVGGLALALGTTAWAVTPGHVTTFDDATTGGWASGGANPNPPAVASDLGPAGAGDDVLVVTGSGAASAGGKIAAFNTEGEFVGDWTTAGADSVTFWARAAGSDATLRVALEDSGGARVVSTGTDLFDGDPWQQVSVTFAPDAVLSDVAKVWIFHNPAPTFPGPALAGAVQLDDVRLAAAGSCGDGLLDAGEACDDGDTDDTNGCPNSCLGVDTGFVCGGEGEACTCDAGYFGALCQECPGGAASPCSGNGTCDDGSGGAGVCACDGAWSDSACGTCPVTAGVFGAACQYCPGGVGNACSGNGTCDDQLAGDTGLCSCVSGFGGADCSVADAFEDATIELLTPANNTNVPFTSPGAAVTVAVAVTGGTVGPSLRIRYYLDGVGVAEMMSDAPFTFTTVPAGRRHLAARLVDGSGTPLASAASQDGIHVRVQQSCATVADCDDGLTCSNAACTGGVCSYGGTPGCCDSDLECAAGSTCIGNACAECAVDSDCGDLDICTTDTCVDGACVHDADPLCCTDDTDCDDGDLCTFDSCNGGTCEFTDNGVEGCCTTTADCVPDDPCQVTFCYAPSTLPYGRCRFGPLAAGCCADDADCDDGNPCTADTCSGGSPGACTYSDLTPAGGGTCCLSNLDCADGDPATDDACVAGTCENVVNPNYCALPSTSALVINEIMAAPGVQGDLGEWLEVYNASDTVIDLDGWALDTGIGDEGGVYFNGTHAYVAVTDFAVGSAGLNDAHSHCVDLGGYLVTVNDISEHNTLAAASVAEGVDFFIGYTDELVEGSFGWFAGNGSGFTKWASGEPNQSGDEDCTLMWSATGYDWNDETCPRDTTTNFFCEFDANPGYHVLRPVNATFGSAGLLMAPGDYKIFARSNVKPQVGFTPDYRFGAEITPFADPATDGDTYTQTLTVRMPSGMAVDSITYDETWAMVAERSLELSNPFVDNADPTAWGPAGSNPNPTLNQDYGLEDLPGSPRSRNRSTFQNVIDAGCTPAGAGTCEVGVCTLASSCAVESAPGCCLGDGDCNDFDVCTIDTCDVASNTCNVGEVIEGCCNETPECDDGNPCNLDRCIGNVCRHSLNIVPGCCADDGDCDDDDNCTAESCDLGSNTCDSDVVDPGAGLLCCNTDAECDDGDDATADLCDPVLEVCTYVGDPNFCDSLADLCDDGDPCTDDSCDVANTTCLHEAVEGCCASTADCPEATEACTASVCDLVTNTCGTEPVADCCVSAAECDDASVCTLDECVNDECRNTPIPDCCVLNGECDDGDPCSSDFCDSGTNTCAATPITMCCTEAMDPTALEAACGADSDGAGICYAWECQGNACVEAQNPACCFEDTECDDSNSCTFDTCEPDGSCRNLYVGGPGCCQNDTECASGEYCELTTTQCATQKAPGEDCLGDTECTTQLCILGSCAQPLGLGEACTVPAQCSGGTCVDGVCCESNCDGLCETCNSAWPAKSIAIDGDASDFGPETRLGSNVLTYSVTWDVDAIYVVAEGMNLDNDDLWVALDQDTQPDPSSGVVDALGGLDFGQAPARRPEYAIQWRFGVGSPDRVLYYPSNGLGGWDFGNQQAVGDAPGWTFYGGYGGNPVTEVRIPRAYLGGLDPAAGFGIWLWGNNNAGSFVWTSFPPTSSGPSNQPAPGARFLREGPGMCTWQPYGTDPDSECGGGLVCVQTSQSCGTP